MTVARFFFSTLLTLLALSMATTVWAKQPSPADLKQGRAFAIAGARAYKAKNFKVALKNFDKAKTLYPSGQVWRMTGYTLMALEQWTKAADALDNALKAEFKPLSPVDAEHAEDNLAEVLKHVAIVDMRSTAPNAEVNINDEEPRPLPLKVRLGEGVHRFVVRAPGHDPLDKSINLEGGKEIRLDLNPNKRAPKPKVEEPKEDESDDEEPKASVNEKPSEPFDIFAGLFPYQREVGMAVGGVGLGLTAAAIATGVAGLSLRSAVQENIDAHQSNYDPQCSTNSVSCHYDIALINQDGARAQTLQNTALILGISGAASVAVGGALYLIAPNGPLASPSKEGVDKARFACLPWTGGSHGAAMSHAGLACAGRF